MTAARAQVGGPAARGAQRARRPHPRRPPTGEHLIFQNTPVVQSQGFKISHGAATAGSGTANLAKGGGADFARVQEPLSDRSRFAGAEYGINRALFGPDRDVERAIDIAARFWNVNPKIPTDFSAQLAEDSLSGETRYWYETGAVTVRIGPSATTSARNLMSTMFHEGVVHVGQIPDNWAPVAKDIPNAVNELEAYDRELAQARRLGLSSDEISALRSVRADYYNTIRGSPYQSRVDAGNYRIDKADLVR